MPVPFRAPCADKLRDEFDALFPNRDKASDGWVGNTEHSTRQSDHNPDPSGMVHAIDVDEDLRPTGSSPRVTLAQIVEHILDRCRDGVENRLWYIIYEHKLYSRTYGWVPRAYYGPNPHTLHAHFSFRYVDSLEASRVPWLSALAPDKAPDSRFTPYAKVAAGSRAVELWDSGDDVKELQRVLDAWYGDITLSKDGYFGPATDEAVRLLQERAELEVDGIAGPATWRTLGY